MQLVQNDPAMEQAWGVIKHLSADEQERAEAEAVEKARRDMVARLRSAEILGHTKGLAEGKAAGLAEGMAQGKAEGKLAERLALVTSMLSRGYTTEQISDILGLVTKEVQALAAKANLFRTNSTTYRKLRKSHHMP